MRSILGLLLSVVLLVTGAGLARAEPERYADPHREEAAASDAGPLAGRVIVIDPGHQLGNARFPARINRLVPAGGFKKPCNTTGTSTDGGYPEATFTWRVAQGLRRHLENRGARVIMTRSSNSLRKWGPCVDV